jgi:cysteine-rich repeat protein
VVTSNDIYVRTLRYLGPGQSDCGTVCGNGLLEATEQCDDGNTVEGDGCSSTCTVENGFVCRNPGAPCTFLSMLQPVLFRSKIFFDTFVLSLSAW